MSRDLSVLVAMVTTAAVAARMSDVRRREHARCSSIYKLITGAMRKIPTQNHTGRLLSI